MFDEILKRIEAVDWTALGNHIYGGNKKIPLEFANLLSKDAETRNEAIEFLLGDGQVLGSVYDTTPTIVTFLLEFLKAKYAYPEIIVYRLSVVCKFSVDGRLNIYEMRQYLRIYETLATEIQVYYDFLRSRDIVLRKYAVYLLGCFSDRAEVIADWLRNHYADETELSVQRAIIWSLSRLIKSIPLLDNSRDRLVTKYQAFYRDVAETNKNLRLRTEAALAFVALYPYLPTNEVIPEAITNALIEGFKDETDRDFDFYRRECIKSLSLLPLHEWFPLIDLQSYSPKYAHLIIRGGLINLHANSEESQNYLWALSSYQNIYQHTPTDENTYRSPEKIQFLKRIVECDAFWELPTNLLSQFGGLPDDREALRKFIEEHPPFHIP